MTSGWWDPGPRGAARSGWSPLKIQSPSLPLHPPSHHQLHHRPHPHRSELPRGKSLVQPGELQGTDRTGTKQKPRHPGLRGPTHMASEPKLSLRYVGRLTACLDCPLTTGSMESLRD